MAVKVSGSGDCGRGDDEMEGRDDGGSELARRDGGRDLVLFHPSGQFAPLSVRHARPAGQDEPGNVYQAHNPSFFPLATPLHLA